MPKKKEIKFSTGKPKKNLKKRITKRIAYYDADGNRKGKTFTAYSDVELAEKISEWNESRDKNIQTALTVLQAVSRYIDLKAERLSPSTVAAYKDILRVHIDGSSIADIPAHKLKDSDVQLWISDLSKKKLSTKTIKNCYSLVSAAEKMFCKKTFSVSVGQQKKPDLYCPSNEDIEKLLSWIKEHKRYSLERAVLLAAFGPLRRGEICALTADDIDGNMVSVTKSVVRNEFGEWEIKPPKTTGSYRTIEMPSFVIEKLKGIDGKLIDYTPHSLGEAFREAVRESGVRHFRFHDLRHYAASIMNYNGISDKTIMQRGGWATTHVMKRVYQNEIDSETKKETEKILTFFGENFSNL